MALVTHQSRVVSPCLRRRSKAMADWGGAQWFVVFLFAIRALLGLAVASGRITVQQSEASGGKIGQYIGKRVMDGLLIAVLTWGGFF